MNVSIGFQRLLLAVPISSGQSFASMERPHFPCEYTGAVSRRYPNTAFAMSSEDTKARATYRVDLSDAAKQYDVRGTIGIYVLVGPDGVVICTSGFLGHPIVLKPVEEAVRQWKFKPLKEGKQPVAFVGSLYFMLCNIGCTETGHSMTLLTR
jgi:hypothetical protein